MRPLQIFTILPLILFFFSNSLFAQCPASAVSLGQGNGLQLCWPRNEAPAVLDSIIYDGVTYAGRFVNGGQGDCWRTTDPATLGVNGNHVLQVIIGGLPVEVCFVEDGNVSNALPITLAYFGATLNDDAVLIEWQTMEEENNDYFLVERSTNAVDFEIIAKIDGAGTVNEVQFYEIEDETAIYQKGTYYYRLKQVDFDGSFSYSDVVVVENKKAVDFELTHIFPNPATDQITVLLNLMEMEQTALSILDMTGRIMQNQVIDKGDAGVQNINVNIANLQSGCYLLRVQSGELVKTIKFIKI